MEFSGDDRQGRIQLQRGSDRCCAGKQTDRYHTEIGRCFEMILLFLGEPWNGSEKIKKIKLGLVLSETNVIILVVRAERRV